jgi:hypothetical protein
MSLYQHQTYWEEIQNTRRGTVGQPELIHSAGMGNSTTFCVGIVTQSGAEVGVKLARVCQLMRSMKIQTLD